MELYSLTFDFGSASVKAALVDSAYQIVAWCNKAYRIHYPQKGWVVQDPDEIFECMCRAAKDVIADSGIAPGQIKGVALSHTGQSIVFVDEGGRALSQCVMWMDGRGIEQAARLNARLGRDMFTGKNVIAKLAWFVETQPEMVKQAHKMLDLSGYLLHRLTGEMAYEFTGARTTRLFDVYSGEWDDAMFEASGFPKRLAPRRVVRSHEIVGRVTQKAGERMAIPQGTPVFGGCVDHAAAVLGSGCIHPGDAHVYVGTSAWIAAAAPEYTQTDSIRPSPIPGSWYHYMENDSGGSCIDYLIRTFYPKELAAGEDVYALVCEESSARASYSDVLFLPFLTGASAPISDVKVRASLLNIEAGTTRGQIARAVLEGIGFNLLWLKEFYQSRLGWNVNFLRGVGGGMLLPESVQTIANILEYPITVLRNPRYAGTIGIAACIETGLNGYAKGYEKLAHTLVNDHIFRPDVSLQARYKRLYPIYKSAFHALSGVYGKLNAGE